METAAGTSSADEDFLEWPHLAFSVGNALFLVVSKKTNVTEGNWKSIHMVVIQVNDLGYDENDNEIT